MAQANSVSPMSAWESFFDEVSSFMRSLERQSTLNATESFSHYVLEKISMYSSSITSLLGHMRITTENITDGNAQIISDYIIMLEELFQYLQTTAQVWDLHLDEIHSTSHIFSYLAPAVSAHLRPGRPRFDISQDQLEYLSSMSFSWTKIASMLGVSRMTVYRRRMEYGIEPSGTNLSDRELTALLQQITSQQPALGETMLWGRLKSMGFHVTRSRLRFALREIDPLQQVLRWSTQLARRQPYSVPGPNSLWHIGNVDIS